MTKAYRTSNFIEMPFKGAKGAIAAFLLSCFFTAAPSNAEMQQAPSSHVKLDLPEGFSPSGRFSGFIHDGLGVTIVIAEFPEQAFTQMRSAFTPQSLGMRGITDVQIGKLSGRKDDYIFVRGKQQSRAGILTKFMLSIVGRGVTALITVNVPAKSLNGDKIGNTVIADIFESATIVERMAADKEIFRMTYLGPFHERTRILGAAKGYELIPPDRKSPALSSKKPKVFFIVAPSTHKLPVTNVEQTSNEAFKKISGLENLSKVSERKVEISSLKGYEITGSAKNTQTGESTLVFQTMLVASKGGFFRILGFAPESEKDSYLSEFRRMAAGFVEIKE